MGNVDWVLYNNLCFIVTFYASLYKPAPKRQYVPYDKLRDDRRLSSDILFHVPFRVPNVFLILPSRTTTV